MQNLGKVVSWWENMEGRQEKQFWSMRSVVGMKKDNLEVRKMVRQREQYVGWHFQESIANRFDENMFLDMRLTKKELVQMDMSAHIKYSHTLIYTFVTQIFQSIDHVFHAVF